MNYPCRDFSVAPFGRSIEMTPCFNVCSRRTSIVRCSIFKRDLSRAPKRQGWERLCGDVAPPACRSRVTDSGKPHCCVCRPRAGRAAFERTARRARLGVAASISPVLYSVYTCCNAVRKHARQGRSVVPKTGMWRRRGARQRAGRMAGRIQLKINKPCPRGEAAGAGRR